MMQEQEAGRKAGMYLVPFAFEMYGRIEVDAGDAAEAFALAREKLEKMTVSDMMAASEYLAGSEEIDEDGVFIHDGQPESL